jgi:hypothetical protein
MSGVLGLSRNGTLEITESNFEFLKSVAKGLGNGELIESLVSFKRDQGELDRRTHLVR